MDKKRQARQVSEILGLSLFLAMLLLLLSSLLLHFLNIEETVPSLLIQLLLRAAVFLLPIGFVRMAFVKMRTPVPFFSRRSSAGRRFLISISSVCFLVTLQIFYSSVFPSSMMTMGVSRQTTLGELILMFFVYVTAPAVWEEFYFRGTVMRALTIHRKLLALLISSLAFGLMHVSLEQFPIAFLCGLIIGTAYLATASLGCAVFIHLICNLIWYAAEMIRVFWEPGYSLFMNIVFALCVVLVVAGIPTIKLTFATVVEDRDDVAPSSYFWSVPMALFLVAAVCITIFWQG